MHSGKNDGRRNDGVASAKPLTGRVRDNANTDSKVKKSSAGPTNCKKEWDDWSIRK